MHTTIDRRGFTLIELLIVIVIISVLSVGIGSSYTASLRNSRDNRRKADLNNIQKALELYYEDNQRYPAGITSGAPLCHPSGCATRSYMQSVPGDPRPPFAYAYQTDATGSLYRLYSCIENTYDTGNGVNQAGYTVTCGCAPAVSCKYGIASTDTTP